MASNSYKEFVRKYQEHKGRLFNIITELKAEEEQLKYSEDKVKRGRTAAVATSGAGLGVALLGLLAAPFTLGGSLVVTGVAAGAGVSGAATAAGVEVAHDHEVKKAKGEIQSLKEEFEQKIQSVRCKLDATLDHKNPLLSEIKAVSSRIRSCRSGSIWALEEALKELDRIYEQIYKLM